MKKIISLVALAIFLVTTGIQAQNDEIFNLNKNEISKITVTVAGDDVVYTPQEQQKFDGVFSYFVIVGNKLGADEFQITKLQPQNQLSAKNEVEIDLGDYSLSKKYFEKAVNKMTAINTLPGFKLTNKFTNELIGETSKIKSVEKVTKIIVKKRITKPGLLNKLVKVATIGFLITAGVVVLSSDMAQPLRDQACQTFSYLMEKAPEVYNNVIETGKCIAAEYANSETVKNFGMNAWNVTKECAVNSFTPKPEIINNVWNLWGYWS